MPQVLAGIEAAMIIRTPGRDRYVIISKVPLEDERLSWKARGLLAYLLSKPDNWSVIVAHLVKQAPDGRSAVMAGLQELETAGYLVRKRTRDDEGRYDGTDSEIYEEPSDTSTVRFSDCGFSDCGKSDTNEERPLVKKEKDFLGSKNRARDQLFDALVEVCQIDPKALTSSARGAANRAIKELREVEAEPEQIVQAARAYRTRYPGAAVTPSALAKHWPSLLEGSPAPAQTAAPQCSECRGTGYVTEDNDARIVSPCWSCS